MAREFQLDPRLAADSRPVADLGLCTVRLMEDARFPWLLLVPRQPDLVEIIDLDADARTVLMEEIARAAAALQAVTACDKLNIGALGNMVRQLHVHIIGRFEGDAAWPGPVWGVGTAEPYADTARERLVNAVAAGLAG